MSDLYEGIEYFGTRNDADSGEKFSDEDMIWPECPMSGFDVEEYLCITRRNRFSQIEDAGFDPDEYDF